MKTIDIFLTCIFVSYISQCYYFNTFNPYYFPVLWKIWSTVATYFLTATSYGFAYLMKEEKSENAKLKEEIENLKKTISKLLEGGRY